MRTGWHYTPASNLPSIQERGLVPSSFREDLRDVLEGTADEIAEMTGLFVWERWQTGREHFGMCASVTMRHHAAIVAVLQVEFPDEHTAQADRPLHHDGHIDGIEYHRGEPFSLVTRTISPDRIRVVDLVPGAAALGYLLGASGVLAEWQDQRIALGLPPGPAFDAASAGRTSSKIGRNEPCPCGSGRKQKRCHAN